MTVAELQPGLLGILQHTLGLDQYGQGKAYRNHFVAGGKDVDHCRELVALGYMVEHQATQISGGNPWFHVTDRGIEAVARFSPTPPPPPKLTRAQQRYRDYCRSECGDGFAWFLGIAVPELQIDYVRGRYQYRYVRRTYRDYYPDWIEGEWKPTKKEAKSSYKAALKARKA